MNLVRWFVLPRTVVMWPTEDRTAFVILVVIFEPRAVAGYTGREGLEEPVT